MGISLLKQVHLLSLSSTAAQLCLVMGVLQTQQMLLDLEKFCGTAASMLAAKPATDVLKQLIKLHAQLWEIKVWQHLHKGGCCC